MARRLIIALYLVVAIVMVQVLPFMAAFPVLVLWGAGAVTLTTGSRGTS